MSKRIMGTIFNPLVLAEYNRDTVTLTLTYKDKSRRTFIGTTITWYEEPSLALIRKEQAQKLHALYLKIIKSGRPWTPDGNSPNPKIEEVSL